MRLFGKDKASLEREFLQQMNELAVGALYEERANCIDEILAAKAYVQAIRIYERGYLQRCLSYLRYGIMLAW